MFSFVVVVVVVVIIIIIVIVVVVVIVIVIIYSYYIAQRSVQQSFLTQNRIGKFLYSCFHSQMLCQSWYMYMYMYTVGHLHQWNTVSCLLLQSLKKLNFKTPVK